MQCCKDSDDSTCEVHYDTSNSYKNLTDGKICGSGICVAGSCDVGVPNTCYLATNTCYLATNTCYPPD